MKMDRLGFGMFALLFSVSGLTDEYANYPSTFTAVSRVDRNLKIISLSCYPSSKNSAINCQIGESQLSGKDGSQTEQQLEQANEAEKTKMVEQAYSHLCNEDIIQQIQQATKQSPVLEPLRQSIGRYCEQRSLDALMAALAEQRKLNNQTCHISTNSIVRTFEFDKSARRWISRLGPIAPCQVVKTAAIYRTEDGGWMYEMQNSFTEQNIPQACAHMFSEGIQRYHQSAEKSLSYQQMNCVYLTY